MKKRKKVIKKIKWKSVLKIMIFIIIIVFFYLALKNIPIKHIQINGNKYLSDINVITSADLTYYPKLFSVSSSKIKKNLLNNPYINNAKVRKTILGEVIIDIEEAKILFYNRNNNKLILSNKKEVDGIGVVGYPVLTNYVPDSLYERLIANFSKIDNDVISLISEIIYEPWKNGDVVIDDTRFFLRMNDGNHVYVNLIHLDKLNNYIDIYATLEGKKGTLYLDSSSDKISFSLF